jgi:hypothetical protein
VEVNDTEGEYLINYKATAIDEQTAIKAMVAMLRATADAIEKQGFPYKEVTVSEPKSVSDA